MIVAVGFIDPGNWAANLAAGSQFGYKLLWVITLSTLILAFLQHNAAHLGIVTGKCLSENATIHLNKILSRVILSTAMLAAVSTALAEILGAALALQMLFKLPLQIGAVISGALVIWLLFSNSYRKIEKFIMGFVSLIGISFLVELFIAPVDWGRASVSMFVPDMPSGSVLVIMSILGAVVMPHNLFLHSEVIQSRQWNLEDEDVIKKQLKYEFTDTIFSLTVGWIVNTAIVIIAAALFFSKGTVVTEIDQAQNMLKPLLGNAAAVLFALALLLAGIASSLTAGMAGGSIFAGIFNEPYDIRDSHSKIGVLATMGIGVIAIFLISSPFKALIYSQTLLSVQLPITIFFQIYLTSSKKVMGKHKNTKLTNIILVLIGIFVTALNIVLLFSL
ncbi:MAG: Nramp family divalent metal transporter [Clostridiales bacterium]|jgi:manganese transport protein|nr:Nramp family divalent metal transporter [Clostridiales bacterium]